MYRMTIVAGPNQGTSFPLARGETSVGRNAQNSVVLSSGQVSKRHCVLVASDGKLLLRDEGSANGTFVNGVLVKTRALDVGDRVSVGEFVLEISETLAARGQSLPDNVLNFPTLPFPAGASEPAPAEHGIGLGEAHGGVNPNEMPKDIKGKAFWYFENYAMPIFYGFNLKHEWRLICAVVFMGFLFLNIMISVQPLLDANYNIILSESGRRAGFMALEIAERNAPFLAAGAEGKTEIGLAENADNVNIALLLDLDQRILAPAGKAGQFMVKGEESRKVNAAIARFRKGDEREYVSTAGDSVVAIAPVKYYNQRTGKNSVVAAAVVAIDASVAAMSMGDVGVVYSEVFILTALVGALMLFVLYRLTLKPFQILNEDMDKALKGDIPHVTHEFKMVELNPLWDLINSAIQRIPRHGEKKDATADEINPEQFVAPVRMLAEMTGLAIVICSHDRKIVYANAAFEDLSGIRADSAVGQELGAVARDQSLGVMASDLFDRARPGGEPVSEDYDFSGVACTLQATAFGEGTAAAATAFVLGILRKPE